MGDAHGFAMRRAAPEEADALRGLTLRAKASWGYATEAMALWQRELSLSPTYILANDVWVVQVGNRIAGYAALERKGYAVHMRDGGEIPPALWLDHLYVEPALTGCGIGALLFHLALGLALERGETHLYAAGDPNAAGFFGRMAARPLGVCCPSPGRAQPVFCATVPAAATSAG